MTVPTPPKAYAVRLSKAATKLLRKMDRPVQARIIAAIATLSQVPFPAGAKALTGHPGLLRIRVGDYRVIYQVDPGQLVVLVVHLGHRRNVYEAL